MAGAFYRTEEAKAARLPQIKLTASITSISSELFVLQNHNNPVVSLGASLLQPIFLGGQLQAQVDVLSFSEAFLALALLFVVAVPILLSIKLVQAILGGHGNARMAHSPDYQKG